MSEMTPLQLGQVITMAVPDRSRWVRLACLLRGRPVPKVLRDFVVVEGPRGLELAEIRFRED